MDLAIHDLEEAWAPVHKTDISFLRTEVNPQFVGVVPPSDVIISTTFEVELENASGTIALVIPYATIEPIKNKLNASFQTESDRADKEWTGKLEEHLRNAEANVQVNLGSATITVGDLVNLNVGDVIPLAQDADGELNVMVEGVPKFRCFFGVSRGNRAVQVTRFVEED
jgi:flagellar motor switch protein FliM